MSHIASYANTSALTFLRLTVEEMAHTLEQATMPSDGVLITMKELHREFLEKGSPASIIQKRINDCNRIFGAHATASAIEELRYQGFNDILPANPNVR